MITGLPRAVHCALVCVFVSATCLLAQSPAGNDLALEGRTIRNAVASQSPQNSTLLSDIDTWIAAVQQYLNATQVQLTDIAARVSALESTAKGTPSTPTPTPQPSPSPPPSNDTPPPSGTLASLPLVREANLIYQGSFLMPKVAGNPYAYGATALAFDPARGSLWLVGHDWYQLTSEIAIPQIKKASRPADLASATIIQPLVEATEGKFYSIGDGAKRVGGILPYDGKLYLTEYLSYDASSIHQSAAHFVRPINLSIKGQTVGPIAVGSLGAGMVSGYFGLIPSAWQGVLGGPVLNGNCCLSIISRTSFGPAAFVIDPHDIGSKSPVPATPLVYYPGDHPLREEGRGGDGWSNTSLLFNGTSEVHGVVFPENTRSVLFFGRHGIGPFCYGAGQDCSDPSNPAKGTHAYPYAYYVWAYDALDLAAVRQGTKKPWDVRPYAVWSLPMPFAGALRLNGATYDPATGRIFVSQDGGDSEGYPVIHVFTVQP